MSPFSTLASIATLAVAVAVSAQTPLTIITPSNVIACQPVLVSFSGGVPPYDISVLPGSSPDGPALEDLGTFSGSQFTWKVNVQPGQQVGFLIRDSQGATQHSGQFPIGGTDTSCLNATLSVSGGGSANTGASTPTGASNPPPGSSTPGASTTAPPSSGTSGSTPSKSGGSTASSPTKSSGAAYVNTFGVQGAAAVFGAAVMAVLA